ncbi:hypothetical protein PanWU01x14_010790 [Parasponia andersonii]|uniref:Transmembrane protein n=1 Tax=Parasponia andersonii TaxID=3476 RepID=A0A2P5E2V3_PARAD|nr:hypothetical protein PanWU01x14_010790 [Parasponia andersonii]
MNKLISLLRPSIIFFFSLLIFSTAAIQFSQAKPARKLMRVAFSPPPPPLSARQVIFAVVITAALFP